MADHFILLLQLDVGGLTPSYRYSRYRLGLGFQKMRAKGDYHLTLHTAEELCIMMGSGLTHINLSLWGQSQDL